MFKKKKNETIHFPEIQMKYSVLNNATLKMNKSCYHELKQMNICLEIFF